MVIAILGLYQYQKVTGKQEPQKTYEGRFEQSILYKKSGNNKAYINAESSFKNILHSNPNHLDAFFELIETLILIGSKKPEKFTEAKQMLDRKLQSSVTMDVRMRILQLS